MPNDVMERVNELLQMEVQMPIRFEECDENLAEFENEYSGGWVEVFVLCNNEEGIHYFWRRDAA